MGILKKLFVLLFLLSSSVAAFAAVGEFQTGSCSVFSEADDSAKETEAGEGKEAEEEPDCE